MDINIVDLVLIALVSAGGGFVQRVSGFGLGIFVMLFFPYFMPSHAAAATVSCMLSCGASGYNTLRYRRNVDFRAVLPMLIAAFATLPFAVMLSANVPATIFEKLLGALLVLLSIFFLFLRDRINLRPGIAAGAGAGALSGVLNGLFSTGGPPVVLYLTAALKDKNVYFASIQFFFFATNVYSVIFRAINGMLTLSVLLDFGVSLVACLFGNFLGRLLFDRLNPDVLRLIIYVGMAISGVIMLI